MRGGVDSVIPFITVNEQSDSNQDGSFYSCIAPVASGWSYRKNLIKKQKHLQISSGMNIVITLRLATGFSVIWYKNILQLYQERHFNERRCNDGSLYATWNLSSPDLCTGRAFRILECPSSVVRPSIVVFNNFLINNLVATVLTQSISN